MPGDGHQRVAAVQPDEGTHVVLSSRNQGPKGHQRGGLISPVSPQPPDVHIAAARPASAAAERQHAAVVYPQPLAKQRRPASAGVHKRPITPAGSDAVASPSMSPSKTAVRPLSAAGKLGPSSNAAMARLKAELAGLASIGNVQLQSLRPSTPAAADIKRTDACSELEAKVSSSAIGVFPAADHHDSGISRSHTLCQLPEDSMHHSVAPCSRPEKVSMAAKLSWCILMQLCRFLVSLSR